MYYVYEWFNTKTNEIFYVGKGTKKRYKNRKRNSDFNDYIKNNNCDSRIIKYFENEKDAFEFEYIYINQLKSIGQCKCNLHCGGAGGSGEFWTEELRKEYSEHNVMKSQAQRERMSKNNPMKNKEIAMRVNAKNKKAVIINGVEYSSIKDACKAYNTCGQAINYWCKRGRNASGDICRFKDQPQVNYDNKRYNRGGCRALTYKNKHYESPIDIARELNIKVAKIYLWAKNGFDEYGNICRYDDDTRQLEFKRPKGRRHPIIVNNIKYNSILQASKELNISTSYLRGILVGKEKSIKYICKYDNQ